MRYPVIGSRECSVAENRAILAATQPPPSHALHLTHAIQSVEVLRDLDSARTSRGTLSDTDSNSCGKRRPPPYSVELRL